DLGHPAATELHNASQVTAAGLEKRLQIIGRIRYETALAVAAAQPHTAQGTALPFPGEVAEPTPAFRLPEEDAQRTSRSEPQGRVAPRRSSVQVTLLIVGVSLLSIAAIFFLVYAFINFGIVWRSVIIGAITVAAFAVATQLRRRSLSATAEGISAFAVVLIYLDAYALRANDLFGAATADEAVYWGVTLIVAAIGFVIWHRISHLRTPGVVGFATFAPGVGTLVGGLTQHFPPFTQIFWVLSAIAIAGILHRATSRGAHLPATERIIVLSTAMTALVISVPLALALELPGNEWAPTFGYLVITAIAAIHATLLVRSASRLDQVFARIAGGIGGFSGAVAVAGSALLLKDTNLATVAPLVAAVAVGLALELLAHRRRPGVTRSTLLVATSAAVAAAALVSVVTLVHLGQFVSLTANAGVDPVWLHTPVDDVAASDGTHSALALLALLIIGALAALAWWAGNLLRKRAWALTWLGAILAVSAAPQLHTQWLIMVAWLAIAVLSLGTLRVLKKRSAPARQLAPVYAALLASALLGYLLGWASTATWWIPTLVIIAILIAARPLTANPHAKAALLGIATTTLLLSVGTFADQIAFAQSIDPQRTLANHIVLTSVVSIVVLLAASITGTIARTVDRRVVFWISGAASAVSLALATAMVNSLPGAARSTLLLPEFATGLATAALTLIALTLWVGLGSNHAMRPERIAASIGAAPALFLLVTAFVQVVGLPELRVAVAPVTAGLLAATAALVLAVLRPSTIPRWARELSVALVSIPALYFAVANEDPLAWLVLAIAAVTTLLLATDADGLFTSQSIRRHLGWLALALGVAGFWSRLDGDRVTDLAVYVVPVSLAFIVIAQLIQRATRRSDPIRYSRAAPLVTLAGVLISLLPLGVNAASGPAVEAVTIAATSAVALIGGSAVVSRIPHQWTVDVVAIAGVVGLLVTVFGRAMLLNSEDTERDAWIGAAFLVLVLAAFLQARKHPSDTGKLRAQLSQWLVIVAMTALLAIESLAFTATTLGSIRALIVIALFAALHTAAFLMNRPPLTQVVGWVAIGLAVIAAVVGLAQDAIDPRELASVPIAGALLITGSLHLRAVDAARSWPWLGPGVFVLLVPSLLATIDDHALWRLVGLGVVGVAVIVIAVTRRLQAPFVIAVLVVLIHGVATFLPQLRAVYQAVPWWLWLGLGGILLIVLAARYEHRIQNLKNVAMRFASLR
ncbi:MAG: hypothetical protein ABIW81_04365, partial [Terrimesophilobacter sp.]